MTKRLINNSKINLEPALAFGGNGSQLQTVPEMAKYADSIGHRVLAGVNGDFFHATSPWGIGVKNGVILKDTWEQGVEQSYLAILFNGEPHIGDKADFRMEKANIMNALSGTWILELNNVLFPIGDQSVAPSTGVGITDDNLVYFIVVDGRNGSYSNGLTLSQLGEILKACGAKDAINLDGGGSSTFIVRNSEGDGWQVRNRPSDGGPRAVGNAWLVISDSQ